MRNIQRHLGICLAFLAGLMLWAPALGQCDQRDLAEYQTRVQVLTEEIQGLEENLTWLRFNIRQMQLLQKPVPDALYQSERYKKNRIKALKTSRKELTDYLARMAPPDQDSAALPPMQVQDTPPGVQDALRRAAADQGLLEWFDIHEDGKGLVLKTTLPILFPSGSAVIAKEYRPFLEKISGFVKQHPAWIVVDGYADRDPIRTQRYPSNFELGAIRAANVVHALVGYGADPSRFKIATTGKYRFPEDRPMKAQKALERYVNITLRFDAPAT